MKFKLNKITAAIAMVVCAGMVCAMDSTMVLPASGKGNSLQANPQQSMSKGYTSIYTNYSDYTKMPAGVGDVPTPPANCNNGDMVLSVDYAPTSTVNSINTSYSCDCSSITSCAEYAACVGCLATCNILPGQPYGCNSCPDASGGSPVFMWSGTFTGASVISSITCGSVGYVSQAAAKAQATSFATARSVAGIEAAELKQIIALTNGFKVTINNGFAGAIGAALISAANTVLSGLCSAANAIANAASSAWCAVSGFFGGGGCW